MKKAFITGATGFIGINLVERLLKKNWEVTALHLPQEDLKYLSRFDVNLVAGDIVDYANLKNIVSSNQDVIFHLAGDTSTWKKHAKRQYAINVTGTANVCRVALERNIPRFVLTSSSSAYGIHKDRISEKTPSNAMATGISYHQTKYLAELKLKKAVDKGLNAVTVNPCNLIGPYDLRNWSQLIVNVCKKQMPGYPPGAGTFAHVRDIADAHIAAAEKGRTGENYLLGGIEKSFKEVIDEICAVTGTSLSLKPLSKTKLKLVMVLSTAGAIFTRQEPFLSYPKYKRLAGKLTCDSSKAIKELDFKTTSTTEMIQDCFQWLKQEGML